MKTILIRSILVLAALALAFASAQMMDAAPADELNIETHPILGSYLVDADGRTLYIVVNENQETVTCTGACAVAWPPFTVESVDGMSGDGMGMADDSMGSIDPDLVGTIAREDGTTQFTYAGHPLYYYVGDVERGQVKCQAIERDGGTWYVLAPDGTIITTPL